jgi:hypothetical protein
MTASLDPQGAFSTFRSKLIRFPTVLLPESRPEAQKGKAPAQWPQMSRRTDLVISSFEKA